MNFLLPETHTFPRLANDKYLSAQALFCVLQAAKQPNGQGSTLPRGNMCSLGGEYLPGKPPEENQADHHHDYLEVLLQTFVLLNVHCNFRVTVYHSFFTEKSESQRGWVRGRCYKAGKPWNEISRQVCGTSVYFRTESLNRGIWKRQVTCNGRGWGASRETSHVDLLWAETRSTEKLLTCHGKEGLLGQEMNLRKRPDLGVGKEF